MEGEFTQVFEQKVTRPYLRAQLLRLDADITRTDPRLEPASNPVMRYLRATATLSSRRIFYSPSASHRITDELYFGLTSRLLQYLEPELDRNARYKQQCLAKLTARDEGPFQSAFAELVTAGYLKSLGHEVQLNSSAEAGMPDVVSSIDGIQIGHDAKLYADEEIYFDSKVNRLLPHIVRDFGQYRNMTLQVLVSDIEAFTAERLKNAVEQFVSTGQGRLEGIWVTAFENYTGEQGTEINLPQNHFSMRIIPSQPMDAAIARLGENLRHSVEQINLADVSRGVSWVFFTHDSQYGSKQMIVQQVTNTVPEHATSGMGLVMIEVRPMSDSEGAGIQCKVFTSNMPPEMGLTEQSLYEFLDRLNLNGQRGT